MSDEFNDEYLRNVAKKSEESLMKDIKRLKEAENKQDKELFKK